MSCDIASIIVCLFQQTSSIILYYISKHTVIGLARRGFSLQPTTPLTRTTIVIFRHRLVPQLFLGKRIYGNQFAGTQLEQWLCTRQNPPEPRARSWAARVIRHEGALLGGLEGWLFRGSIVLQLVAIPTMYRELQCQARDNKINPLDLSFFFFNEVNGIQALRPPGTTGAQETRQTSSERIDASDK